MHLAYLRVLVDVLDGRALDATAINLPLSQYDSWRMYRPDYVTLSSFSLRLTTSHAASPTAVPQDHERAPFALVRRLALFVIWLAGGGVILLVASQYGLTGA
ncbi:MAG TPA: hypothetical protein VMS99_01330 [Acidimicrobiia bacterium]|nr:hypothetical protein [Acidimicrobiia bacterium]